MKRLPKILIKCFRPSWVRVLKLNRKRDAYALVFRYEGVEYTRLIYPDVYPVQLPMR